MATLTPLPPRRPMPPKVLPRCSLQKAIHLIETQCGPVQVAERHGTGSHTVIFLPEATRELEVMISYGRRSPMNEKEQKYIGYGHFLTDEQGHFLVIVKHFIEILTKNRSAVSASNLGPHGEYNPGIDFLAYFCEEFLQTEAKYNTDARGFTVDPFLSLCGPSEFVLEGHTHPDLGVFYSQTDKVSGAARASKLPVCIFVCDPIRKTMLGSIGKDFEPCEVIVYTRQTAPARSISDLPPADQIVQLAGHCLQTPGYSGTIRTRTTVRGQKCLTLKLLAPAGSKETPS